MTNKYKRNFYILLVLATLASISLGYLYYHKYTEVIYKDSQITALTDTVTLYKTKQGLNGAVKTIFVGSKDQVLDATKQTNTEAYNVIKNTKGIQSYTELKTITKIDTVVKIDTVFVQNGIRHIKSNITNPYYTTDVSLMNDSLQLGLKVINDFDIVTRYKPNGFLKPKTLVVDVINKNPYTVNSGLTSFEIQPKKKTGLKISLGLAVGVGTWLLLK